MGGLHIVENTTVLFEVYRKRTNSNLIGLRWESGGALLTLTIVDPCKALTDDDVDEHPDPKGGCCCANTALLLAAGTEDWLIKRLIASIAKAWKSLVVNNNNNSSIAEEQELGQSL